MHAKFLAAGLAMAVALPANAAVFSGYTAYPGSVASGQALAAHDAFVANLASYGVETFDGFAPGSTGPLALSLSAGLSATLTGNGAVAAGDQQGVFATSGAQDFYTHSTVDLSFSSGVYALGFYATDVGDQGKGLTIYLDGVAAGSFDPAVMGAMPNGNLIFFGVISDTAFTNVELRGSTGGDGFGFDDITVGTPAPSAVPEPASWAMFISGFGVIGAGMRRKKASVSFG